MDGAFEMEIGYMIRRSCWRKRFAHEAASAVRDFTFNALNIM
jgi:RimJ/RimL family protein N-acetyltransferase